MRQDYMDIEYIDGVFDKDGRQVIRPLNDAEKTWLNQFYTETTNANINHDGEARKLTSRISELTKANNKEPSAFYEEEIAKAIKARQERYNASNFYSSPADHKKIYDENNARNRCVLNRLKGTLEEIDAQLMDKYGAPSTVLEKLIYKEDLEKEVEEDGYIEKIMDEQDK